MKLDSIILSSEATFCDGELEYSSFEGGYFDPEGGTMYYITDWQGNNAAVVNNKGDIVQKTAYYPYGEPTVEPAGQRFLFGGKEREHAAGRNTYDFSARSLTPYGNWNVVDPKAEDFYPFSPYTYCGGDPINNIDLWGLETINLSSDSTLQTYVKNIKDTPKKLTVYSHGNYSGMDYNINNHNTPVNNGETFIEAMHTETKEYKKIENEIGLEIEIKACNTWKDNPKGEPNIAKKISEALPNAFITAPNGRVKIGYKKSSTGKITEPFEKIVNTKGVVIPLQK